MLKNEKEWASTLRDVSLLGNAPVKQKDGKWEIVDRKETWKKIGPRMTDAHLDRLLSVAVEVLTESDPQFDLEPSERFAAAIHGKVLAHSRELRRGLAETLALLGSDPSALTTCSHGKAEGTAVLAVRGILQDADAIRWASLNDCLETLAEAAPTEFLDAIEAGLEKSPSPFLDVFGQESGDFFGRNYTSSLLWGLEALAWSPDYLSRVIVILGDLAALDPGGKWANRPANSLVDILLPWHPQTTADIPRRRAAVEALLREQPAVAWKLLLALLPTFTGSTSGSHKPRWRAFVPPEWTDRVTNKEYWEQVSIYANLAVEAAITDLAKLVELVDHIPSLPPTAHAKVLQHLASASVTGLADEQRQPLWEALVDLAAKHRRYPEAKWAMPAAKIKELEELAQNLAPTAPRINAQRLFISKEWSLYTDKGSLEEQRTELSRTRQEAVSQIIKAGGLASVLAFAREVEAPWSVGIALGEIGPDNFDDQLLPSQLLSDDKSIEALIGGFVMGRHISKEWRWADAMLSKEWASEEKARLLLLLPFEKATWARAERILMADAKSYWAGARVFPPSGQDDALEAARKLLSYGRPLEAIECLNRLLWLKVDFPADVAADALLALLKVDLGEGKLDSSPLEELISWLQSKMPIDSDKLFQIEWAFLPLLGEYRQAKPRALETRLSMSAEFFCELIRICFRSTKEAVREEPTPERRRIAENAYHLLHEWTRVPGLKDDGTLDGPAFASWLSEAKRACEESGHLGIALDMIGKVLPFAPADPGGLWIHSAVAEALNAKDAEKMRAGFTCKLFNMRGAHGFTAGKEELALAASYHKKADALDQQGFQRFAASMREFAKSFERDAERESKRDPLKD